MGRLAGSVGPPRRPDLGLSAGLALGRSAGLALGLSAGLAIGRPFLYRGGFQRFSGRGLNGRGAPAPRG